MRATLAGAAALTALVAVTALVQQAGAAVGVCKPLYSGARVDDRSEQAAKARALESWGAGARQYGIEYTRWGIAWNRRLDCTRTPAGLFACQAIGHPCTLQQVPPENFIRFRRGSLP
jgi:hypothetical protein